MAGQASARPHLPPTTRFGPETASTARRCIRCVCGSTTFKPGTCPPGRPRRSPRISTTRPGPTWPAVPGGPTGWRSTTRCGSAGTGCICRATATRRRSPSPSRMVSSGPRPSSGGPTTLRHCSPPARSASTRPPGCTRRKSDANSRSRSPDSSLRPSNSTERCCRRVSRRSTIPPSPSTSTAVTPGWTPAGRSRCSRWTPG